MSNNVATIPRSNSLVAKFAGRYSIDPDRLLPILKSTAFRQRDGSEVSNEQMAALLVVADQYGLNPFCKEIFAFPDKGGIVPVVGVDGWARIINTDPAFDGMDFEQDEDSCTCIIYRKDRAHPVKVTEYMSECKRGTGPWSSHPKRMLRHKAMIQCARIAFGYGGIFDEDEAERIVERDITPARRTTESAPPVTEGAVSSLSASSADGAAAVPTYSAVTFAENLPKWRALIESGKRTAEEIIATVESKAPLSDTQKRKIKGEEEPS